MTDRLKNRVAVVTGSGRGIGKDIALAMAREGAKVVTNNRKRGDAGGDAEITAKEITQAGGQAVPFFCDISKFEEGRALVQTAIDKFGRIDILVNNAGIRNLVPPWEMTEENWDSVIGVIMKGTFNTTRHAIPYMKEQKWGRIINCTSGCWISCLQSCHYAAGKGGVVGFTRALAADLFQYGITCNAYHPFARTLLSAEMSHTEKLYRKRLDDGLITREEFELIMSKPGPEGIGAMVAYLATDNAAKINGKVFFCSHATFSLYTDEVKKKTVIKKNGLWTVEELMEKVPKELLAE